MMLVPYPLYPTDMTKTKQSRFNLNTYMNTEGQMCDYISF